MDLLVKEWKVPPFLSEHFPEYALQLTPYSIPSPFYAHRVTVHIITDEGLEGQTSMSRQILVDAVYNDTLKEFVYERINKAVARAKDGLSSKK